MGYFAGDLIRRRMVFSAPVIFFEMAKFLIYKIYYYFFNERLDKK